MSDSFPTRQVAVNGTGSGYSPPRLADMEGGEMPSLLDGPNRPLRDWPNGLTVSTSQDVHSILQTVMLGAQQIPDESQMESTQRARRLGKHKPSRLAEPLLLIGIGGFGRQLLTSVKARMLEMSGVIPENVAFLAFDSGSERIVHRDRYGQAVQLIRNQEYFELPPVPIEAIKRAPEYNPKFAERLGDILRHLRLPSAYDGARQRRSLGLSYILRHEHLINREIDRAIRRIAARESEQDIDQDAINGINAIIAHSTCGGQGSGGGLDTTAFVRQQLRDLANKIVTSRIVGVLALPSIYPDLLAKPEIAPKLMVNHASYFADYAAVCEATLDAPLTLSYDSGTEVELREQPFDQKFVLEAIDENGNPWSSTDDVIQMAARTLTLLFTHDIGLTERAFAINADADTNASTIGSFGMMELDYPAQQVAALGAVRVAAMVIGQALDARTDMPTLPWLSIRQAEDSLMTGGNLALNFRPLPVEYRRGPLAQLPTEAYNHAARVSRRNVTEGAAPQLQRLATEQRAEWLRALEEWQARASKSSLTSLEAALTHARRELLAAKRELRNETDHVRAQVNEGQTNLTQLEQEMRAAASTLWGGRRTHSAVDEYLRAVHAQDQLQIRLLILQHLEPMYTAVEQWLHTAHARVQRSRLCLTQVQKLLQDVEEKLAVFSETPHRVCVVDREIVDELLQPLMPNAEQSYQRLQQMLGQLPGGVLAWGQEGVAHWLRRFILLTAPDFVSLINLSIEQIMRKRWPDKGAEAWLSGLERMASVAWNLNPGRFPPGNGVLTTMMVLGVPDIATSMFTGLGVSCISTGDPTRIMVLRTAYGASIDDLQAAPHWRRVYERHAPTMTPSPHIFPQFQASRQPTEEIFILGQAFGYIEHNRHHFHYHPADTTLPRVYLGQGIDKALAALSDEHRVRRELHERIGQEITRLGMDAARQRIDAYLQAQPVSDNPTISRLLRTLRDYGRQLHKGHDDESRS